MPKGAHTNHRWIGLDRPHLLLIVPRWLLLSWVLCLFSGLSSSGLLAQTLEEALVSTYLSNPTLTAQRATLRATTELVAEAKGDWRPTLAIESAVQAGRIDSSNERGGFTESSAALVLEQNLFRGGETTASVEGASHLVLYQRARLTATEQDVFLAATEAYAGLVNDLAILELARKNEGRLAQQLDGTKKRFKAGELTGTDVAQAEARFAGAVAERDRAISAVEAAKALYRSITDQEPTALSIELEAMRLSVATEAEALLMATKNNPTIRAARYRLDAAKADIDVAKAAVYPTLDLQAALDYTDEPGASNGAERKASIGLELRIPLYQGGAEYARIRRARQTTTQFEDDLEAVQRSVSAETSRAWQDLRAARSRIGSIEQQVLASEKALKGAQKEAEVGQRTTLDVLDLENDLFEAEVDLATARRDEVIASHQLGLAIGRLTAEDLDLPVERYDAERYDQDNRGRLFGVGG